MLAAVGCRLRCTIITHLSQGQTYQNHSEDERALGLMTLNPATSLTIVLYVEVWENLNSILGDLMFFLHTLLSMDVACALGLAPGHFCSDGGKFEVQILNAA